MQAEVGENYLNITLSSGVVFHTTPTLLHSLPEHRIIPFTMIKEQRGNWEVVRDWFEQKLGWRLTFNDHTPINIPKERDQIEKFERNSFNPAVKWGRIGRNEEEAA